MTEPTKNHIQGVNKPHGANLSRALYQLGPREYLEKQTNPYFGFLSISRISHEVNITLKAFTHVTSAVDRIRIEEPT